MRLDAMKIKILLAEQQMTQTHLAKSCSVSKQDISRILAKGKCSPVVAGRLAAGLGVHVTEILSEVQ